MISFSFRRMAAMMAKEFLQMRRDRLTFGMMAGVPILQLFLFGFAINSDPKHLPCAIVAEDGGAYVAPLLAAMEASGYFAITGLRTPEEAAGEMARGDIQFYLRIPPDFTRRLLRRERPQLLLVADATDPSAVGNASSAMSTIVQTAWARDFTASPSPLAAPPGNNVPSPVDLAVHKKYNPQGITKFNIVPGLMGVILTMTMVMITALAITRERERGTMENLLSMPLRPLEVMIGKIVPYILVGYLQIALIMLAARLVFKVPLAGNLLLLGICGLCFIAANLAVGVTFSSIAQNQLQAMQMSFFFFLPSLLLSGFMFPFRGMPLWAQWLGEAFPLTHFNRIVREILLKGGSWETVLPELLPICLFFAAALGVALNRYRQTLD